MVFIYGKIFIFLYQLVFEKSKNYLQNEKCYHLFSIALHTQVRKTFQFLIIRFNVERIEVYFSIIIIVLSSVINL